jgi:hypothetical protein
MEIGLKLIVSGKFVLDSESNPPPLKAIRDVLEGTPSVALGRNVELRLGRHASLLDGLLDARVVVSRGFAGLGDVEAGCAVLCVSNSCREWARRAGRPRTVAKIIGVMADEARFVLLTPPKLKNAPRGRHESSANRIEAGLVPFVILEPGTVQCAWCLSPNTGEVSLEDG